MCVSEASSPPAFSRERAHRTSLGGGAQRRHSVTTATFYAPVNRGYNGHPGEEAADGSTMAERRWLLLAYRVPRKTSASRVYVWRKLKRLGALAIQDGVWVLPDTPRCKEQFQWLAAEIAELDGNATLWEGNLPLKSQEEAFVRRF